MFRTYVGISFYLLHNFKGPFIETSTPPCLLPSYYCLVPLFSGHLSLAQSTLTAVDHHSIALRVFLHLYGPYVLGEGDPPLLTPSSLPSYPLSSPSSSGFCSYSCSALISSSDNG